MGLSYIESVGNKSISLFDEEPSRQSTKRTSEKIMFKNIPMHVSDDIIANYLEQQNIKLTAPIKYGRARDSSGGFTQWKNGERFTDAESPLPVILPKRCKINEYDCIIYHLGQKQLPCKACNISGHKMGDFNCPAQQDSNQQPKDTRLTP